MILKLLSSGAFKFKKLAVVIMLFLVGLHTTYSQEALTAPKESQASIIDKLKKEFQNRNPNIGLVKIVDVRPTLTEIPKYLVLGWASAPTARSKANSKMNCSGCF